MKLIGYAVLFLVCFFVSLLTVGILLPGNSNDLAQGGKAALSFALALILTAVIAKLINKTR
jgi:membrane protein DedA with SNARE-associated domain